MPPLTILHLITGLDRGGAQTMLVNLVGRMDRNRFRSIVVSLTDEGVHGTALRDAGIAVLALGMRRGRPSLGGLLRLRAILAREQPDLVQTWLYHADLLGLLAGILSPRRPLLWNLRCADMELERYSLQVRAVRAVLSRSAGWPAAVLVNSEAGRRYHESIGYAPRRWELVPNGFDTEIFRPDPASRALWRQRLGVGGEQRLVGMVARVDPMKDHATFLVAAKRAAADCADAAFLLVGAGTEALPVPDALKGRLRALGERSDVAEILPALDLMILSSRFGEGFPNVIGEAMACGVPVVASNVGDAAAIIGEAGATVPPGDADALADALRAFLGQSPERRAALGAAARQRVIAHYSLDAIVGRYERIYAGIAGGIGPAA